MRDPVKGLAKCNATMGISEQSALSHPKYKRGELDLTPSGSYRLLMVVRDVWAGVYDNAAIDDVCLGTRTDVVVASSDKPVADSEQEDECQNHDSVIHL